MCRAEGRINNQILGVQGLFQCDVLSIVEVKGHWVFMLTQKQDISELIDQC